VTGAKRSPEGTGSDSDADALAAVDLSKFYAATEASFDQPLRKPIVASLGPTAASKKRRVKSSATARRKVTSAATPAKAPPKRDEPKGERVTKQERLLTLLSQSGHACERRLLS
jgi:hypothetical protein